MKKIKSTVTYTVPGWNFCNNDNLLPGGRLQKGACRFCVKSKSGYRCSLYDEPLSTSDGMIEKTRACCKATAGYASSIDEPPPAPTIDPRDLMKQTIELYSKTLNDLINQGYPRAIAETVAKQHLLGT